MEDEKIVITLPLPPEEIHPNKRTRNHKYHGVLVKETRGDAHLIARGRRPQSCPWKTAELQATFYMPRKRDEDGLIAWLKSTIDGITDAGIIVNDSGFRIVPVRQVTGKREKRRVVITLTRTS